MQKRTCAALGGRRVPLANHIDASNLNFLRQDIFSGQNLQQFAILTSSLLQLVVLVQRTSVTAGFPHLLAERLAGREVSSGALRSDSFGTSLQSWTHHGCRRADKRGGDEWPGAKEGKVAWQGVL